MAYMSVTIEDASVHHLDRLHEIERECFKQEAFTKQQLFHLLVDYNSISLIAKADDEIAGFIIGIIRIGRNALVGHILTVDVSHGHRRKGVGLLLLQRIEELFREKGVRTSHLEVREDNPAALSLYEKCGYRKAGRLKKYYGNADGLCLRKTLV